MTNRYLMILCFLMILTTAVFGQGEEEYIKILTPSSGWTSNRVITISGITNVNVKSVRIVYNSIPLRLPVSGNGRFSREFVAGPGLNSIYAEAVSDKVTVSDTLSFYSKAPPKAMKIVLMWDTDGTDIDLHVTEPTGEECYYGYKQTSIGGSLDVDIVDGYGPEIYTLATPTKGSYQITLHYYSDNGYPQTQATVYVVMNEGTPNERVEKLETMLTKTGTVVNMDVVTFE